MKHQIFLSFSSADRKLVEGVQKELRKLGVSSFGWADLSPGKEWRRSVIDAIRKSDSVVLFFTEPEAPSSAWSNYEIGAATAMGKEIFIAKPNSLSLRDLPLDLSARHVIDFDPTSPRQAARSLATSLSLAA
jgi:hypothetical protein